MLAWPIPQSGGTNAPLLLKLKFCDRRQTTQSDAYLVTLRGKCYAIGHSLDWYALLQDDTNSEIMCALYERYLRDDLDVPSELIGLRLISFFI